MYQFTLEDRKINIYTSDIPNKPIIYLNTFSDNGEQIYNILRNKSCLDFNLAIISGINWNHDMAPWDIPPISKDDTPCTGGAEEYLHLLTEKIIPETEKNISGTSLWRGIVGYSLAGLFTLYSLYKTDIFVRAASISGSLWFPKFKEYVLSQEMKIKPECIYFSLGDKECKTRNPYLKPVQENTKAIEAFYASQDINTVFKLNTGNHFENANERTVAGIEWLLKYQ